MTLDLPGGRGHPTWLTVVATAVGYAAIFAFILVALFVGPYVLWTVLG